MYRKTLVIVTLNWTALSWGFLHGQMAGLIGALQKKEDGIELSEWEISLLGAFVNLFMIVGLLYVAVISEKFGRKVSIIISSLLLVINWIILYYARTFTGFLLSKFFAGLSSGPIFVLVTIASAEYISCESRAVFVSVVLMVVPSFGMGLGHVLGVLYHWRTLALIGIVMSSVHVVLPYFWMESPHWLASKGRFEECELVFRKLHGNGSSSEHELLLLIKMETKKQKAATETNTNNTSRKLLEAFKKRYFWDLMLMSGVIYAYYAAAGKVVFSNLANVILEDITGTPEILLYTIIVDGFILLGTCISCFLIKKMCIRTLLFSSGFTAIGILTALSASLYFTNNEVYFQWLNVILLSLYFIVINAGPYPVLDVLMAELFPLELKLYCFLMSTPLTLATVFLCLILFPYIVKVMGYHGLFLLNSGIMFVCLAYFYLRLPETKGKTLQEIEMYFKTNSYDVEQVLSPSEQINTLI